MSYKNFIPKSFTCFKEGYTQQTFLHDLFAGVSVGIIALPLALAFAIGSGVTPEKGLYTAIVAGFLISLLGGSRVQIGGPTGAFVVIVYAVIQKHGYEGLAAATFIAGILMILMGLARCGGLLKFIPYPVTTGFTTGIAVVIASSQIKDFFGLQGEKFPTGFLDKCNYFCQFAHTWNGTTLAIAVITLVLIFIIKRFRQNWPATILAIAFSTILASLFHFSIETVESKFGAIPQTLQTPSLPFFSFELFKKVLPDAITIALLGAIESLLSALVADGMTGNRHRSNIELVSQGIANIGSILFGGIPATGAIARTTANINMGARTPVAGMIHAITLLLLMVFFAPIAGKIPLAALAGVLLFVAWNMSELPHFIEILKARNGDALVLLITFLLTVLVDLTVAVQVGVILAAILFLKHMTEKTVIEVCKEIAYENEHEIAEINDGSILFRRDVPSDIAVFEIRGPFFYSVANLLDEALLRLEQKPRVFILRVKKTPLIDATGIKAIKNFHQKCRRQGIKFIISDINPSQEELFKRSGIEKSVGSHNIVKHLDQALRMVS